MENENVEAYSLNRGEFFVWMDRLYVIEGKLEDRYMEVRAIAAFWPSEKRWMGSQNPTKENFNGYAKVKKIVLFGF